MPVEVKVPTVGESITTGVIGNWSKQEGDFVKVGDVLFEVETDKVTSEVYADTAGILHQLVAAGTTVDVGQVVATIDPSGTAPSAPRGDAKPAAAPAKTEAAPASKADKSESKPFDGPLSPAVRKIVEETGANPSDISGTGKGGRLTKGDVIAHNEGEPVSEKAQASKNEVPATPAAIAQTTASGTAAVTRSANIERPTELPAPPATPRPVASAPAASGERTTRKRMTTLRAKIANRLLASQHETASLTTFNEVDMTNIMALRAKFQDRFVAKHGTKLGFMSLFVQAVIAALKAVPNINARIDGQEIVVNNFYDIGVAISTEKGLMVPVLRDADQMSLADIEKSIAGYAKKARDGKITLQDLDGGSFTITNGGVFGSLLSTPILNPPQSGILGMHSINERPVAINGRVEIRPMMYLALTYDHRLVDGKEAVTFLVRIKEFVEQPGVALLSV
ncbi:MAG: 2-oxoglutarate dehydrogenase complex dihydrolipoyllysine-residue succinyltransferase [Candidatus Methylacidiphilales bacterium]|nr:2-oxoglutarate dehydrogenase complex dihydrolipoyllysine-residue succinyltransferase [Candidatus Methylacidiphilales bacterium]